MCIDDTLSQHTLRKEGAKTTKKDTSKEIINITVLKERNNPGQGNPGPHVLTPCNAQRRVGKREGADSRAKCIQRPVTTGL